MAKAQMWMVRAGEGGYLSDEFRKQSEVAIGWNELGDLTGVTTLEKVRALYLEKYPTENPAASGNAVAMIHKFRNVLKPGQKVITYNPETREYLVGTVKGEYRYDPTRKYRHVRTVEWEGTAGRDALSPTARNSLGSTLTLFQLSDESADDVLSKLGTKTPEEKLVPEEKEELEQLKEDTISRAHELIKDKILKLSPDQLEQLVAAILRAMGYKARVTPKGPDRGVDVFASPDGLGLEEPRIKAEVKHRRDSMGSPQVRSFIGGLREGDRGLCVSTGGFSKDANYEAERSNIPVTLLNLDELATLIVTHYENFDMDGKLLVPLTRLYWPTD